MYSQLANVNVKMYILLYMVIIVLHLDGVTSGKNKLNFK